MHLKNIQINVDWCLKIMLILFILHKDKNVVTFWKKKSTIFYDIKIINALIYALVDISLARMETVCFIQPRRNMKTHSLILWWTLLKGQQLCFITILVQVNLSDTIYMYRNLGIDYRTTDMMQMLPNLSNMEILHFRVSRKNVEISGPKNHENLRINS